MPRLRNSHVKFGSSGKRRPQAGGVIARLVTLGVERVKKDTAEVGPHYLSFPFFADSAWTWMVRLDVGEAVGRKSPAAGNRGETAVTNRGGRGLGCSTCGFVGQADIVGRPSEPKFFGFLVFWISKPD